MKGKNKKNSKQDYTAETYISNKEDWAESRTVAAREPLRSKLQDEIESFLAQGGKITKIEPNLRADPPRKPTSNYGSQPI